MDNLHAPQRLSGESTDQYRARRIASRIEARITERGMPNTGRFRQLTNPEKNARRLARKAARHVGTQPKLPVCRTHKPTNPIESTRKASPRQRAELARRKAMGVALIQRPLRYIDLRTTTQEPDAKGVLRKVKSADFKRARHAANRGLGDVVRVIARRVAA